MIKILMYSILCFATNPIEKWIDLNTDILEQDFKSISFELTIQDEINNNYDNKIFAKIVLGNNKKFRFELGERTITSDGLSWKSHDKRTNQIFIQKPDKILEKHITLHKTTMYLA